MRDITINEEALRQGIKELESKLGNDRATNDKILIEINGLKIELHKQESLRRIGVI